MGSRGPVPKRMAERLGHVTKVQRAAVEAIAMAGPVRPARLPRSLHPIARGWYRSLRESGQSAFFEPSDWAAALFVAEALSRILSTETMSAQAFAAAWSAMTDLLSTEASRRRVQIEVQREKEALPREGAPTALDEYRKALQP
jgi:hypothetical protein